MANILISFSQEIVGNNKRNLVCFYESLASELTRFGNKVLLLNLKHLKAHYNSPTVSIPQKIDPVIKQFQPDLIIAFNNQVFESLIEATSCPIVIFDADSIALFSNKDLVAKHLERYHMVTLYEGWENLYKELNIPKNRVYTLRPATSIKSEPLVKDKDISFIGSNFGHLTQDLVNYLGINQNAKAVYQAILYSWQHNEYDYEKCLSKFCGNHDFSAADIYTIFDSRKLVLSSLLDLGINLYGAGWERTLVENSHLAIAFDTTPTFSVTHNQNVYNSSKICLSISHPQTRGYAFPWRIYDIMASNGLLISSYSKLLQQKSM